jgi:hypothetical protein
MTDDIDPVLEGLTDQQLKDSIIHNVKDVIKLKKDGKAYSKSVREAVKVLEDRSEEALELLEIRRLEQ